MTARHEMTDTANAPRLGKQTATASMHAVAHPTEPPLCEPQRPRVRILRFEVFGRSILVTRSEERWSVFYVGAEGKKRPATDIVVPPDIPERDVERYLGDLCHEWATERHPEVRCLD